MVVGEPSPPASPIHRRDLIALIEATKHRQVHGRPAARQTAADGRPGEDEPDADSREGQ